MRLPLLRIAALAMSCAMFLDPLQADQTGKGRRFLAADNTTRRLTIIGGDNSYHVLEVTPAKEIVWKVAQTDLPGITVAWVTRVERLPNGNPLFGNCHAHPDNPQFLEVTPDKRVVWAFKDFKNFGDSMPVQLLLAEQ